MFLHRLWLYYQRRGIRATGRRCVESLRRWSYLGRTVLYVCPLPVAPPRTHNHLESSTRIQNVQASQLSTTDFETIANAWNPSVTAQHIAERFAAGAELWLARIEGALAGFGWSIKGATIVPNYVPLQPNEVHLFDFFVFPNFRGRGVNPALVDAILCELAEHNIARAYIECAAWNAPQLRSLEKTPFLVYGEATKVEFLGRTVVIWHKRPFK